MRTQRVEDWAAVLAPTSSPGKVSIGPGKSCGSQALQGAISEL